MAHIELHFPVPFYIEEDLFSQAQNKEWADKIFEIEKSVPNGGAHWEGKTYTTHSTYTLIDDPLFTPLIEKISNRVHEFTKAYGGGNYVHSCNSAWPNISRNGNFQEFHTHENSVFSCVYYPLVPENSGRIVFEDPKMPDMLPVNGIVERNEMSFDQVSYEPKEGMLLIFRSYMRHRVKVNESDNPRISIALNFS
jgi:uncharacterized protein (TIGR02466 family)